MIIMSFFLYVLINHFKIFKKYGKKFVSVNHYVVVYKQTNNLVLQHVIYPFSTFGDQLQTGDFLLQQ